MMHTRIDFPTVILGLFLLLLGGAIFAGELKVAGISSIAFGIMLVGAYLGQRSTKAASPRLLVVGYGLASGAMLMSAAIFLVPSAVGPDIQFGAIGIAAGLLLGYTFHTVSHYISHLDLPLDDGIAEVTTHALFAGVVIGVVYSTMPTLGAFLGVAIISHKGPAGYALAARRANMGNSVWPVLYPAAAVGITALPIATVGLTLPPAATAVIFGVATGIFIHAALDFLPSCEAGGELHDVVDCCTNEDAHAVLDSLRLPAVGSTIIGSAAVILLWVAVI